MMVIKNEAKRVKREARLEKRAAKKEAENAGPHGPAGAGTQSAGAVCAVAPMPLGSPVPMQPMQQVLPPIAVELSM